MHLLIIRAANDDYIIGIVLDKDTNLAKFKQQLIHNQAPHSGRYNPCP